MRTECAPAAPLGGILRRMSESPTLCDSRTLAGILRVPERWLRAEAEAGRLPHVRAGRAILFDRATIEGELRARASQAVEKGGADGQA